MRRFPRFLRFNAVGILNFGVKMSTLSLLVELGRLDFMIATALAVETAILHGFLWHQNWTWRDRRGGTAIEAVFLRFLRYNLTTGLLALTVNLAVMRLLAGALGLHYLVAAVAATATTGMINFLVSDTWIFVKARPHG